MKKALKNQRGETIVEVLVAFLLLMLFLALFTASLRFARRASVQAQRTRDDAYNLTSQIYPAGDVNEKEEEAEKLGKGWKTQKTESMTFRQGGPDSPSFTVKDVQLQSYDASVTEKTEDGQDKDTTTYTFNRYYKQPKSNTAGGTNP